MSNHDLKTDVTKEHGLRFTSDETHKDLTVLKKALMSISESGRYVFNANEPWAKTWA